MPQKETKECTLSQSQKIIISDMMKKVKVNHILRYQIQEKDRLRKREMQDKLYEERAAQLWEQDYQNKIDEQRALHLKRLQAIKEKNSL